MATDAEITQALKILSGARLRNSPPIEEVANVKATWQRVMKDVPGEILLTAVDDLVINCEFWPTLAEMRRKAADVKKHNGRGKETAFDEAFVRLAHLPRPPAYMAEHDRLKAKYADGQGLPTDDELMVLENKRGWKE